LARRVSFLLLAAAGIVVTTGGWALLAFLMPGASGLLGPDPNVSVAGGPWLPLDALVPDRPTVVGLLAPLPSAVTTPPTALLDRAPEPVLGTWEHLCRPMRLLIRQPVSAHTALFYILCGIWSLAVWAFFGGAICRVVAVALAREEHVSWREMLQFARTKWGDYFSAPLIPLMPAAFAVIGCALVGMLFWTDTGTLIAGLLWPLVLLAGLAATVLVLGMIAGWPLMWGSVSAENTDGFDAVSRAYSYVFQRPLNYLFYVLVAAAFGLLAWLFVANFAALVLMITQWSVDWGAEIGRWTAEAPAEPRNVERIILASVPLGTGGWWGSNLLGLWRGCVKLLAVSFLYSYFWVAFTAIYLLLRRDVDASEMDEVYLGEKEAAVTLPEIKRDQLGAPVMSEQAEAASAASPTPPPPPPPRPPTASRGAG